MSDLRIQHFSRALAQPFRWAGHSVSCREGLFLCHGERIIAECSPLPGFSEESLEECERVLRQACVRINGGESLEPVTSELQLGAPAAVAFALEGLRYDSGYSPLLKNAGVLSLNTLISIGSDGFEKDFLQKQELGFSTFKLKVGIAGLSWEEQVRRCALLSSRCTNGEQIRIDWNLSGSMKNAEKLLDKLMPGSVEYFEDYSRDFRALESLKKKYAVPLAFDELAVHEEHYQALVDSQLLDTLIIKPQLYGSFAKVAERVRKTREKKQGVTFSSLLETEVGICLAVRYALSVGNPLNACGFDTLQVFKDAESFGAPQQNGATFILSAT